VYSIVHRQYASRTVAKASANFSVDTRLASLLGENYRSTEAALKELVDNAWDADADTVWITLPKALTEDPIVVRDDGLGMRPAEIRNDYLNIARDRRSRKGERTQKHNRRVKGRKGIGKFAGLAAAQVMQVTSVAGGESTSLEINKDILLATNEDLERINLPLSIEPAAPDAHGTTVTLRSLNQTLNFPTEEMMRSALVYEYGRVEGIRIFVNDQPLTIEDVPGVSYESKATFPTAGEAAFRVTISEGTKTPKYPGIVLLCDGKAIGKPSMFGLEDDEAIPRKLLKRVFGEIEVDGLEDHVTAGWDTVFENSKPLQEVRDWLQPRLKEALNLSYRSEMAAQKRKLDARIQRRLERMPEHRRTFAEAAISRVLEKFYGERPERIDAVADVVLDAMERDEYWSVLKTIHEAKHGDVGSFAEALEQFGLLDLALIAENAKHRLDYLDMLDSLAANAATVEKDMHKAIENSLWTLGGKFHLMASNKTLRRIVQEYGDKKFVGPRAEKRPDLLLAADSSERYMLIEFKRPSHAIDRQDEAQAREYRDDFVSLVPGKAIDVLVIGGRRVKDASSLYDGADLKVVSYADVISQARHELNWLIDNLTR
jgi:hypothetical protein